MAAAAGLYFMLIGLGLLPVPGGAGNLHAPLWILFCAGLAFFLAGAAIILQRAGYANDQGELPATAPRWMHAMPYLIGLSLFAAFAAIGSWIAFGPGERFFSGSFGFLSRETNAVIGRNAFGIGAVILCLCSGAYAISGARKLLGRRNSQAP